MTRRKHDKGECYLCGAPATTRDHIPPEGIFPKPLPENLITVPACLSCNQGKSLDDEYFRVVVAAGSDDAPPSIDLLHQRIIPRMRKKPALIIELIKSAEKVEQGHVLSFNRTRMQAAIDKIVRGLFFHHTKRRLAVGYVVGDFHYNSPIRREMEEAITRLPLVKVGDGHVFNYSYHLDEEAVSESYWLLRFFNNNSQFFVETGPAPS